MWWLCLACGKTSSLVYAIMYAIKQLLGKKDKEGHNPKIMVCSKNITFLAKTWTNAFEQNLKLTNSEYHYDKAKNIMSVGNVEIILVPTEEPTQIYGYSTCFKGGTKIMTLMGEKNIEDITEQDCVLTREGFKKVKHAWCNGEKDCIEVNIDDSKIICTPDHRFIDNFNNEIKAQDLTKTTSLVKIDTKEWQKWLDTSGKTERNLKLLTLMVSDITDTLSLNLTEKDVITPAQMRIRRKVIQLCTEICGLLSTEQFLKGMMYTTKTETVLTTLWKTLNWLQELTTQKSIGNYNLKKNENSLLKQLRKLKRNLQSCGKTLSTENEEKRNSKNLLKAEITNVSVKSVEESLKLTLQTLATVLKNVNDTLKMLATRKLTGQDKELSVSVSSAEKSLKQINMPSLKPAHLTAKTSNVVGRYKVYDIEVEDCHEFFANGVLVHNCLALVDELDELPTDIAMEAVKSINDRVRQQIEGFRSPFIAFATTSQGLKGLYQTVMHFKKSGIGYVLMRARTRDNTYLPADYVKNIYSIYNEKEVQCLLEGQFISIDSGLVFPDYDPAKNMLDIDLFGTEAIAEDDTIYIGQDFNSFGNHAIALVVKKFSDGNVCIVAIKDYVFPDIRRAPQVFRYDFPTQRIVWIPDMTYKEHFTEFKKELRNFNITIAYRSCNPLVNDRTFACNKLFFAERLFITPICKNLEKALLTHQRDPKTGMPMKGGVNSPDHDSDAFGMAVHYLLSWNRDLKPLYEVTLQYIYSKRRARGADATELEVGSQLLSADKLKAIPLKTAPNVEENAFNA